MVLLKEKTSTSTFQQVPIKLIKPKGMVDWQPLHLAAKLEGPGIDFLLYQRSILFQGFHLLIFGALEM